MTTNAEEAAGDFTADLATLRQDVARLAETVSTLVRRQTQAAGDRVSESVKDAGQRFASSAAHAQNRICAAGREIEASIEHHPLTAVLIALAVGMSLGLLRPSRDYRTCSREHQQTEKR